MYKKFYGFKERPFKLVPNPLYLFLSKSHEEALGHLMYAVTQGDGFVEITGEVGTGKTTLVRVFLDKLGDDTEAAYIFNPKLNSIQLLKTINDEFGIDSTPDNTKDLIDILNHYLIQKKADNKKVLLLIDEAQNLSIEVLEQLRLLSNLETTQSKLLQIILVGQPELGEMLDSYELRQLGQRITLSCHLTPLTYKETKAYINHRISVASHKQAVKFTRPAYSLIYQYSKGIPRLINIVCDRALLTGYTQDKKKITRKLVVTAIKELFGRRGYNAKFFWVNKKTISLGFVFCLIFLAIILFPQEILNRVRTTDKPIPTSLESEPLPLVENEMYRPALPSSPVFENIDDPAPLAVESLEQETSTMVEVADETDAIAETTLSDHEREILAQEEQAKIALAVEKVISNPEINGLEETENPGRSELENVLREMDTKTSRFLAINTLIEVWHAAYELKDYFGDVESDLEFFSLAASQVGLKVNHVTGDHKLIVGLNIPLILMCYTPGNPSPRYIALTWADNDRLVFFLSERQITTSLSELSAFWQGDIFVVWKDFFNYSGSIPVNAPASSILTLKMHLKEIGFDNVDVNGVYDETTQKVIMDIQRKNGLTVDGIVGPLTKIVLYNKKNDLKIPHIR